MDFGDHIRALWVRTGLNKEEYAAKIGGTPSHIKNVLTGKWPGSFKTFEKCLEFAKIPVESCVSLPSEKGKQKEDDRILEELRGALVSGGDEREYVIFAAEYIRKKAGDRRMRHIKGKTGTHGHP